MWLRDKENKSVLSREVYRNDNVALSKNVYTPEVEQKEYINIPGLKKCFEKDQFCYDHGPLDETPVPQLEYHVDTSLLFYYRDEPSENDRPWSVEKVNNSEEATIVVAKNGFTCWDEGPSGQQIISESDTCATCLPHSKCCLKDGFIPTSKEHTSPYISFTMHRHDESVQTRISAEAVLNHSEETTVQQLNQDPCDEDHVSRVEIIDCSQESAFQIQRKLSLPRSRGRLSETSIPEPEDRVPPDIPSKICLSMVAISEATTIPQLKQRESEEDYVSTVETIQYLQEGALQIPRKLYLPHKRGPPSLPDPEKHIPLSIPSKTVAHQSAKSVSSRAAFPVTNSAVNRQTKFCQGGLPSCQAHGSCSAVGQMSHHFKYFSFIQLLLLSAVTLSCASGSAFVVAPVSQEVAIGAEAVFRCRHSTADSIEWTVNGSLVGRNPPPDITPDITRDVNGNLVDTLTITARPEYNGTEVVCVAKFSGVSSNQQTEPATLLVLRNSSVVNSGGFLVSPVSLTVAVGTRAVFQCQYLNSDFVTWRINEIAVRDFPDIVDIRHNSSISSLTITARPEYDGAMVECVAGFLGSTVLDVASASMVIQGDLASVTNAQRVSSTLTWVPPPSLDLTRIDPDIAYCVDIYNITCGMRDLIISDCFVTEPSYTSDVIMDGYIYEYTITPRSNVPGARNGTATAVTDEPPEFNFYFIHLSVEDQNTTNLETVFKYQGIPSLVPSSYMLSLEPMDDVSDDEDFVNTDATKSATSTLSVTADLQSKRLWNYKLLGITGCPQNIIVQNMTELSTHDIQNISVSSPGPGSVTVGGDFIQGSTARGVLIITISSTNDTQYHLCRRNSGNMRVQDTISGLASGDHKVSAFVFEESGYPFNRTATEPQSVSVMNGVESAPPSTISYDLDSNSTHVCVTCMFSSSTPTSCLAVVHQRISQLSSSGLMNIESRKFTRSGDTAYGCILTNRQVGVVDGRLVGDEPQEGSSSVCVGVCVAGIAAVLTLLMSLVVFVVIVLLYWKMLKTRKDNAFEVSVDIMDGESARENHTYVDIPSSTRNEVGLTTAPLIPTSRVQCDGHDAESSDTLLSSDNPLPPPTSSPPVIPQAAAGGVVYSELDRRPNPTTSAPPPQGDEPQYLTVNKFKNPQGVTYMCHVVKPSSTTSQPVIIDDSTKTMFEYSELIHLPARQEKTATATTASIESERPLAPSPPTPCTVENLLPLLHSIASEWHSLGEALSLDEDRLDEIFTNNETDEACLRDMLEFYDEQSDSQYTWEEIVAVLKKIGQEEIAEKIQSLHVEPYAHLLPGQTKEILIEGSPTCDATTKVNRPELPPRQRICRDSSSGYCSGKSPSTVTTHCTDSSIMSADSDVEGCVDAGVDGLWTDAPKEAVQPTSQDVPKKDGIVHVHNSGPKFQPKDLKKPVTFQHLDCDSPEQRKVHGQCEDDVETPASMTNSSSPEKVVVNNSQHTVVAPAEKMHHHVTVDENQDASGRKSFLVGGVLAASHVSHDVFKGFTYEQDSYFEVSLGCEDHPGYDKESSYVHSTASSTIQLTEHDYAFKLCQLADKVNVGECLWQIRAQALSQEGSQDHLSDSAKLEDYSNPETMLNKRLKESKLRINFQCFQETRR